MLFQILFPWKFALRAICHIKWDANIWKSLVSFSCHAWPIFFSIWIFFNILQYSKRTGYILRSWFDILCRFLQHYPRSAWVRSIRHCKSRREYSLWQLWRPYQQNEFVSHLSKLSSMKATITLSEESLVSWLCETTMVFGNLVTKFSWFFVVSGIAAKFCILVASRNCCNKTHLECKYVI